MKYFALFCVCLSTCFLSMKSSAMQPKGALQKNHSETLKNSTVVNLPNTTRKMRNNKFGNIVVLGDSFVNIPHRFFDPLKTCFTTFTKVSDAPGYISPNPEQTAIEGVSVSKAGKWRDIRVKGLSTVAQRDEDGGFGADAAESHGEHKALVTYKVESENATHQMILRSYPRGGKILYRSKISRGKIHTRGPEGLIFHNIGNVGQTVTLTNIGHVSHYGHVVTNTDGWVFHKLGNSGAKVKRYLDMPKGVFSAHMLNLNPDLVIIVLGTNDNVDARTTVEDYKRNMETLVSSIKDLLPNTDILLFGSNANAAATAETSIEA